MGWDAGAEAVATLQNLVLTCRLRSIDPDTWLVDVLQRTATHPAGDMAQLTPRRWKDRFADNPTTSHVSKAVPTKGLKAA